MLEDKIKQKMSELIEENPDDKELLLDIYHTEMSFLTTLKTLDNLLEIEKTKKEIELQKVSLEMGLFIESEEN